MVQRSEWAAAHDAAEIEANHYGPADFDGHGHEIVEVDGEHDLFGDGSVLLLPTFGHTPGHQSVLLRAESGDVVLCADACYFLPWIDTEESPPHGRDKEAELQSLRRLRALRDGGARLIPGHDSAFWETLPRRRSGPLERLLPAPRRWGMGGDAAHLRPVEPGAPARRPARRAAGPRDAAGRDGLRDDVRPPDLRPARPGPRRPAGDRGARRAARAQRRARGGVALGRRPGSDAGRRVARELPTDAPEVGAGEAPRARPADETPLPEGWNESGYLRALEWRFARGGYDGPRPATVWTRMRFPLIPDEEPDPLTRVLVFADSGNGASAELPLDQWLFINPELTVHVHRLPEGEWICMDAHTTISSGGTGLALSTLSDEHGPVARGAQSLLIRGRVAPVF